MRAGAMPPLPLLALFAIFLVAIAYLIVASMARRSAPVYAASPAERTRASGWERAGDTLTVDASDGDRWQYVSLARGRVLAPPDTAGWDLAVQRYRVRSSGWILDLGAGSFESAERRPARAIRGTTSMAVSTNADLGHWYRYNMLTHLLEPMGNVYAVRGQDPAAAWKVAILSYYCPKLVAGCLTVRYAPMVAGDTSALVRSGRFD